MLGSDAAELIEVIAHNIEQPSGEAFLQRKVFYDNIGADRPARTARPVRALGGDFAQSVNQLLGSYDRDRNPDAPGGARTRAVVVRVLFRRARARQDATRKGERRRDSHHAERRDR